MSERRRRTKEIPRRINWRSPADPHSLISAEHNKHKSVDFTFAMSFSGMSFLAFEKKKKLAPSPIGKVTISIWYRRSALSWHSTKPKNRINKKPFCNWISVHKLRESCTMQNHSGLVYFVFRNGIIKIKRDWRMNYGRNDSEVESAWLNAVKWLRLFNRDFLSLGYGCDMILSLGQCSRVWAVA